MLTPIKCKGETNIKIQKQNKVKKFLNLLILFPFVLSAQNELYNKGALIYMQPDALIHVQGTFTNTNAGTFQSDGILEVKGNLVNDSSTFEVASLPSGVLSSSNTSNRVVKFVGTGTQYIQGQFNTSGSRSLYNVVVDKGTSADAVVMKSGTPVTIDGSLIFGQNISGSPITNSTYYPSSLYTVNNNMGFLQTYELQTDTATQNIVTISNSDTDAIMGYPSFVMHSTANTGYVLTQGSLGDTTGSNTKGGLQRAVAASTSASRYAFPIGTIGAHGHGYNAFTIDLAAPVSAQSITAKFVDSTSNTSQYEGAISNYCANCPFDTNANVPAPGFNYYFSSDPCNGGNPQWVILEQAIKNHGYWSIASTDTTASYSLEMFPGSYTDVGNPYASGRILKYSNPNYGSRPDYGFDPTTANWTAQIESAVSSINDLLTYTQNTGCYTGTGVPGGKYRGPGNFAMFRSGQSDALPVTLLYLQANAVNNQYINVSWSTAIEINNAGFYVMRSADAVHFTTVGWVPGHDNSTSTQVYAYNDYAVVPNVVYYYKLKQVDNNGHFTETDIVDAQLTGAGIFTVGDFVPNPARNQSKVIVTCSTAQTIEVRLFDMLGRQMSVSSYDLAPGENTIDLNVQQLADATYSAMINAGNRTYARKLVVTRY